MSSELYTPVDPEEVGVSSQYLANIDALQQRYLAENAYILPIFEEPQVFGLTSKVHGFETESVGRPSFYSTWLVG